MSTISQDYKLTTHNLPVNLSITQLPEEVTTITNLPVVLSVTSSPDETQITGLFEQIFLPIDIVRQIFLSRKHNYIEMLNFYASCRRTCKHFYHIFSKFLPDLQLCKSNHEFCIFWKNVYVRYIPPGGQRTNSVESQKFNKNYEKTMFDSLNTGDLQTTENVRKFLSSPNNELDFSLFNSLIPRMDLSTNDHHIQIIPNEIGLFTNLITMDLRSFAIRGFSEEFSKLTMLENLNLYNNKIQELQEQFSSLTNLKALGLCCNEITIVPDYFSRFTNLTTLDISENSLEIFPPSILSITGLQTLRIRKNYIKEIPVSLCSFTHLRELDISSNRIENPLGFFSEFWGNYKTRSMYNTHTYIFPAVNIRVQCDIEELSWENESDEV